MLITVGEFKRRLEQNIDPLIAELRESTGRAGDDEAQAWRESLPRLSKMLSSDSLASLHLYFGGGGHVNLEYQLPSAGAFADAVLLGECQGRASAVVIELKHWLTRNDKPGLAEGLVERQGQQELHPSDQARGYVEYCRNFHSAVQDRSALVDGCVLFTRDTVVQPYLAEPNAELAASYPIFTLSEEDLCDRIPKYFLERINVANESWAKEFSAGIYRQDRGFVRQIAGQIQSAASKPFELLDNQRRALSLTKAVASEVIRDWEQGALRKRVVVVFGPPGSGKSAVAARLWAELSLMPEVPEGDIVFTTTSMSQSANWLSIFDGVGDGGARGVVRKASVFHPTTGVRLKRLTDGGLQLSDAKDWRANIEKLRMAGEKFRPGAEDNNSLITIVDEAHSLVNPERGGANGPIGFPAKLGPQGYHLIRGSVLTVFLLDPEQGFRQKENTTFGDIEMWAKELGAGGAISISLEGAQFRCAGSAEYVQWVESVLAGDSEDRCKVLASSWYWPERQEIVRKARLQSAIGASDVMQRAAEPSAEYRLSGSVVALRPRTRHAPFEFSLYDDPQAMEMALRTRLEAGASSRLLSTFSRKWRTSNTNNPHLLPPSEQDFFESFGETPSSKSWHRVWNVVPAGSEDYTHFIQGKPGTQIAIDPLSEVGCPYAVRGFDYDHVGVLWLEDLIWRDGKWIVNLDFVQETGIGQLVRSARRHGPESPYYAEVKKRVAQAYRILLTRALRGIHLWIKDSETRDHIRNALL